MNRSAELQLRPVRRAKDKLIAPGGSPALQFHGSLSQGIRKSERRLSTNPSPINAPLSSLKNLATSAAPFMGGDKLPRSGITLLRGVCGQTHSFQLMALCIK